MKGILTLGIDSSTQGTKAVVYDAAAGHVVASAAVNYGRDLPEYGAGDGFLPGGDAQQHATVYLDVGGAILAARSLHLPDS